MHGAPNQLARGKAEFEQAARDRNNENIAKAGIRLAKAQGDLMEAGPQLER